MPKIKLERLLFLSNIILHSNPKIINIGENIMLKELILYLIPVTLLIACDTVNKDDDKNGSGSVINFENKDKLVEFDTTISENDTIINEVNAQKGDAYTIQIINNTIKYDVDFFILTPDNDTITNWSFVADTNGTFKVVSFVNDVDNGYTGDFNYSLKIVKNNPLPESFNGVWCLTEEKYSFDGETVCYTYDKDSAEKVLVVSNDSVIDYYYDTYSSELSINYSSFKALSYYLNMNVELKENMIICSLSNKYGSESHKFEKVNGTINDIHWIGENEIKVPTEMIGIWYKSYEYEKEVGGYLGVIESSYYEISYSSVELTDLLMQITADSVIEWYNAGLGKISRSAWHISDADLFVIPGSLSVYKDTLKCIDVYFEGDEVEIGAEHDVEHYTKFTGELPPSQWTSFDLPQTAITLPLEDTLTLSLPAGEDVWFKVSASQGSEYSVRLNSINFSAFIGVSTASKERLEGTYHIAGESTSITFSSYESGDYYVLLRSTNSDDSGSYSISYTLY